MLSQEADDGVEEREYQRIGRTFCEGEMKIENSSQTERCRKRECEGQPAVEPTGTPW